MKKFVFTNERYQAIKENEYDLLKRDIKNIDKEIETVQHALSDLENTFTAERERFARDCKKGISPKEMISYQGFFEFLKERRVELEKKLSELLKRKQELSDMLVRIHNELKVLEEMREAQYAEYLKEVAADEAKELDSHISFTMYEKAV